MRQKIKSIGCRVFAMFLAVMMLMTCIGDVSYAAEIANSSSLEAIQEISEQEQSLDAGEEESISQNTTENSSEIEDEIVNEEETTFATDTGEAEVIEDQTIEVTEDLTDNILQAGGLLDEEIVLPPVMFYGTEGTELVEKVGSSLTAAFDSFASECSLAEYQITEEELKIIFTEVLNTNPRYFYVYGGYSYYTSSSTGYVTRVLISYDYNQSTATAMLSEYDNAVNEVVSGAVSTWSDMEKALYINDYLTRNCQYDLTYSNYDAYDALVSKTAVCQGYALAYMELAEELGLECEVVTSESLNHAWNLISVNGNFYNEDATWNDPTKDLLGRSRHKYFMKSTEYYKSAEADHYKTDDWVVTGGRTAADASDMNYDAYFWNAIDCGFEYLNGYWYNFDGNSEIVKYSCDGSNFAESATVHEITDIWYTIDKNGYWPGKYVGTGSYNGLFYYSTDDEIYTWNPTQSTLMQIFQLSAEQKATGYLYGMHVDPAGDLYYHLSADPNSRGTVNKIVNTNVDISLDVCYVSPNGDDSNTGTEGSPVKTIYRALELISEEGTIYVCDNLVVNDNLGNDAPLVIEKAVTIQAKDGNLPTIDLRAGGIILGADVTFKNVKVGTESYLRPGIAANGHKLNLVNVQEDSSLRPLQIYGGTFIDYTSKEDYGIQYRGSASEITIVGGAYDAIYAGSVNGSINLPVSINVSKGNSLTLGGIYAGSTIKNPSDTSTAGMIPVLDNSVTLPAAVNISVSNNAYVTVVDGVSESNTVNLVTDGTGVYSFDVKYPDNIKVSHGTFTPAANSILGNNGSNVPNVILEGSVDNKATLDISECISASDVISLNNFTGTSNSIFVLNKNHTLTLIGELSGNNIEFRLSGGMPWSSQENPGYSGIMEYNKTYITGGSGNGTFVISNPHSSQEDMAFTDTSSVANGWMTVEGSEYELPKLIDFSIKSKKVSYDEMNADHGVVIDVSATYTEDEWCPYLYWLPLEYKVTYTDISDNKVEYIRQESVEDYSGNYFCDYTKSTASTTSTEVLMRLEPFADEEGNTTIVIQKAEDKIAAGTYQIDVTAPTTSGEVTRTFSVEVTAAEGENPSEEVEPEEITYSISYDGNGAASGEMLIQSGLKKDVSYDLMANTYSRQGYMFNGWNTKADGSGTAYADKASVQNLSSTNGDTVTLYAQWKKVKYTISYSLNGGTNSSKNPTEYYIDSSAITLENPMRTNYTFAGWYNDSEFKNSITGINKGSFGDITLYAKWTVNKYNIVFNGNGSTSGSMTNIKNCNYGSSYTLTSNAFKKTGYSFVGWNTKADGSGTAYKDKASVKNLTSSNGKTVTLYAQWKTVSYTITYNLNGGKNNSKNPTGYNVTTANITLQNPTRTGYTFGGWYSDSKLTKKVATIAKGSTGNKAVYAKWTANKYNIAFKGNGSNSGSMTTVSNCKYGTTYTLKANAFKRTAYTFTGWNTKADGSGTAYKNKASIKNLTSSNGRTVTLYAQWKPISYSIKYNLNGGKNNSKNPSSYTVATSNIKLQNPMRTGYTFGGWYSDSKLTKKVTTIPKGSTGNKAVYAKWTANKYNIAFKGNGSNSGSMTTVSNCKYGTTYTLKANAFKRTGYTFTGWNTKANGSGTAYKNKASIKNLTSSNGKTVTLYAQWKPVSYSIKYNLNGGKNNSKNPASYTVATADIKLQNPTRTGYKFGGWYSDSKYTKKVTTIKKGSTGNKTLYAKWTATKYSIKYNLNGGKNNSKNPASYTVATADIKLQNPSRSSYTFKGWYSDSKCTKKVTTIKKGSTGNKTLYAKWAKK